jgi:hypothetical protein
LFKQQQHLMLFLLVASGLHRVATGARKSEKMSVINAVRFKLLARVVSVVKNDKEYVKGQLKINLFLP